MDKVTFFNEGNILPEKSNCLWLITDGVVKSYTVNQDGRTVILGFWGRQEVIGKSLSDIEPYFLQCMSNTKAISVPSTQWNNLSNNLLERIQQTQQLLYIVRNPQTTNRLWLFLKWLSVKFGTEVSEGILINFKLSEQELADALGMEKILVSRMLNQFEQENLILQPENLQIVLKK